MGKIYSVISGKGGVGKTTSAINLGLSMTEFGKEVIIVDANLTTPNIGLHLGSPIIPVALNHVMNNQAKVEEAIYEHESGTKIMPASISMAGVDRLNYEKLADVTKKLKKIADSIILDSPAGLGEEARAAINASDEIVIITNPEISAVTDALKTIKLAEELNKKVTGAIITRQENKRWEMPLESIKDMLEIPILGIIPEDDSVKESQRMKNGVIHTHPRSRAAKAYRKVSRRILGSAYMEKFDENNKKDNLFNKIFRNLLVKK